MPRPLVGFLPAVTVQYDRTYTQDGDVRDGTRGECRSAWRYRASMSSAVSDEVLAERTPSACRIMLLSQQHPQDQFCNRTDTERFSHHKDEQNVLLSLHSLASRPATVSIPVALEPGLLGHVYVMRCWRTAFHLFPSSERIFARREGG